MRIKFAGLLIALSPLLLAAQNLPTDTDIPPAFTPPPITRDYIKRTEIVPMRDGVKLYTVIVVPKGASHAPIRLTRTPYDAASRAKQTESPHMLDELPEGD